VTKALSVALLTVLALMLGACGSNDDATASKAISDSIIKAQKSNEASEMLSVNKKQADCIGDGWVKQIGTEQLQKYGVLSSDLKAKKAITEVDKMSAGDAEKASDVLLGCADVESMMKKALSASGTVPKQMQGCVNKELTEKNIRPFLEKTFQGKAAEAQETLGKRMTKCAVGGTP
jgi:hypothetical protein